MWSAISRLLSEQLGNAEITQRHALAGVISIPPGRSATVITTSSSKVTAAICCRSLPGKQTSWICWRAPARFGCLKSMVWVIIARRAFCCWNISGHSRLMSRVHISSVSNWRICISGASRRSSASISTITSPRRPNPIAGCDAGRFFC